MAIWALNLNRKRISARILYRSLLYEEYRSLVHSRRVPNIVYTLHSLRLVLILVVVVLHIGTLNWLTDRYIPIGVLLLILILVLILVWLLVFWGKVHRLSVIRRLVLHGKQITKKLLITIFRNDNNLEEFTFNIHLILISFSTIFLSISNNFVTPWTSMLNIFAILKTAW